MQPVALKYKCLPQVIKYERLGNILFGLNWGYNLNTINSVTRSGMLVAKLYFETWANGYLRELILANQHLTETNPDKPDIFMRVNNSQEFRNYIDFNRIVTYKL